MSQHNRERKHVHRLMANGVDLTPMQRIRVGKHGKRHLAKMAAGERNSYGVMAQTIRKTPYTILPTLRDTTPIGA